MPALATIYDAYDKPQTNIGQEYILVRDGCPSYDAAKMAYNQLRPKNTAFTAPNFDASIDKPLFAVV